MSEQELSDEEISAEVKAARQERRQAAQQPPAWSQKVCPIFTHALVSKQRQQSLIQTPGMQPQAPEAEAAPCIGPQCMFFVHSVDENGKWNGAGDCCLKLIPIATNQQSMLLSPIIDWLSRRNNIKK